MCSNMCPIRSRTWLRPTEFCAQAVCWLERHPIHYPGKRTYLARSTLTSQFATVGFRPVESVYLIGGYYTFLGSLGYWAGAHGRPRIARVAWRLAHSTAARLASAPLFTLARWLGSGSSLTYFASTPEQLIA